MNNFNEKNAQQIQNRKQLKTNKISTQKNPTSKQRSKHVNKEDRSF